MRKDLHVAKAAARSHGVGRSSSEVSKPTRLPYLTRAGAGLIASILLVPLAITSESGSTAVWTVAAGHPGHVGAVAIAPDGRRIATAGHDGGAVLWAVGRGRDAELPGAPWAAMHSLCFSPDGTLLAAGSSDASVLLWDAARDRKRASLRAHTGSVLCVAFSPDGTRLATGSADETIRLWDVATGEVTCVLRGHHRVVCRLGFAPGGRLLASGCAGGQVKLWDLAGQEGRERPAHRAHRSSIQSLAFSPDGSTLATWGGAEGIKLWDTATGRERARLCTDQRVVQALAFSADGRMLTAVDSLGGMIQRWGVALGRQEVLLRVPPGVCAAFSPDGRLLVTGGSDGVARVWDLIPIAPGGS